MIGNTTSQNTSISRLLPATEARKNVIKYLDDKRETDRLIKWFNEEVSYLSTNGVGRIMIRSEIFKILETFIRAAGYRTEEYKDGAMVYW